MLIYCTKYYDNTYALQRSSGRRSTNPDIFQTAYAVDHISNRKVIKKVKGGIRRTEEKIQGQKCAKSPCLSENDEMKVEYSHPPFR